MAHRHANGAVVLSFSAVPRSGVCGEECLVDQVGGELLDIEGPIKAGVKSLRIGEKTDLVRLPREQTSNARVESTHQRPLPGGAARSAVADVAHFVGEDLAVEAFDAAATTGSSANNATPTRRSSSNITQPAISDAPTHEGESESFGHENRQLDELAHYEGRRNHLEGQAEDVQYVGEQAG